MQYELFETNNGSAYERFLQTFLPYEETIIRFKFGIGCRRLSDIQIVDEIAKYRRGFRMVDLKRHYKTFNLMCLAKERVTFQIFFDFTTPCLLFKNDADRLEFEAFQLIYELEVIANNENIH